MLANRLPPVGECGRRDRGIAELSWRYRCGDVGVRPLGTNRESSGERATPGPFDEGPSRPK